MAYDNLVLPISVVGALQAKGLYKPDGKTEQETLNTISPDGTTRTHIMGEIPYMDIMTFGNELDIALRLMNPAVQNLFAKNAEELTHLIRGVQYNTRSGFKGSVGAGNALDAVLLHEGQFQDPDAAGIAARTTFTRAIGAASTLQFIVAADAGGANTHGALAMTANEGLAILGFENSAADPCTTTYAIQYLGVNYNVQNLGFEMTNPELGDPIVELKQPLFLWPNEQGLVQVRYFKNGTDELRPIGIWVKMATNLRSLVTS